MTSTIITLEIRGVGFLHQTGDIRQDRGIVNLNPLGMEVSDAAWLLLLPAKGYVVCLVLGWGVFVWVVRTEVFVTLSDLPHDAAVESAVPSSGQSGTWGPHYSLLFQVSFACCRLKVNWIGLCPSLDENPFLREITHHKCSQLALPLLSWLRRLLPRSQFIVKVLDTINDGLVAFLPEVNGVVDVDDPVFYCLELN